MDGVGRLGGGFLAYLLVNKINSYFFLFLFSLTSLIGHLMFCLVSNELISGSFSFLSIHFFIAFGAGAFWTLTAGIIIDDGGLPNFGMNWGLSVFLA